jgi:hypothetical protein
MNINRASLISIIPIFGIIYNLYNNEYKLKKLLIVPSLVTFAFVTYIFSFPGFSISNDTIILLPIFVIAGFMIHPLGLVILYLIQSEILFMSFKDKLNQKLNN